MSTPSITKHSYLLVLLVLVTLSTTAQKAQRVQPVWWFGQSAAANFNFYRGTTQQVNNTLTVPTAFHKGEGVRPYASLLSEYRPNKVWGGMLNVAYDNRGGKFRQVTAPCNCPADLSTNLSYVTIEPSLRIAPFANAFYIFGGPTVSFNVTKDFTYLQEKQTDVRGEWSDTRKVLLSAQAGAGIDIPLSARNSATQATLSPFVSFLTDLGHAPRKVESWSLYTVRAGVALKFGTSRKAVPTTATPAPTPGIPAEREVFFSVRAPKLVPLNRQVKESFPLRNSVFFDMGSSEIPNRYITLTKSQAQSFNEQQLQEDQPVNLNGGRSSRQMAVYHNIINILGDRLRANPGTSILLTGASDKNPADGNAMAGKIRQYLVEVFSIDGSRISTAGRDKPMIPSQQPGGTTELSLLMEGDRRVDIESKSSELMMQVGGSTAPFLKPVQITAFQADPLDSHVLLHVDGAAETLDSWTVEIKDENGNMQYYGPFTKDHASIPGKTILGNNQQGNFSLLMKGKTKTGRNIQKESMVSLVKVADDRQQGLRYSILFDFDNSKTIAVYENFLTEVVTPLITENATVIIHGHTDVIGDEKYNQALAASRANDARQILQRALNNKGTKGVQFEALGFGEEAGMSPFENTLPEERFYNRTVIIDILPAK